MFKLEQVSDCAHSPIVVLLGHAGIHPPFKGVNKVKQGNDRVKRDFSDRAPQLSMLGFEQVREDYREREAEVETRIARHDWNVMLLEDYVVTGISIDPSTAYLSYRQASGMLTAEKYKRELAHGELRDIKKKIEKLTAQIESMKR